VLLYNCCLAGRQLLTVWDAGRRFLWATRIFPLQEAAIRQISNRSMAIDLYVWLPVLMEGVGLTDRR
jgi:hypothetical protein